MVQKQAGKAVIGPQIGAVRLRDHTPEKRGVSTEAFTINFRFCVYVSPALDHPTGNLDLVKIHALVQ